MARIEQVKINATVYAEMEGDEIRVTVNGETVNFDADLEVHAELINGEIQVRVNGELHRFNVNTQNFFYTVNGDQLVEHFKNVPGHLVYVIRTLPLEEVILALLDRVKQSPA